MRCNYERKALRILEYNKIIEKLVDCATSPMGKALCEKLEPSADLGDICQNQMETSDALSRVYAKGSLSFSGLRDIRGSPAASESRFQPFRHGTDACRLPSGSGSPGKNPTDAGKMTI